MHAHNGYSIDFSRDTFSGDIDTTTQYGLVASSKTCFVWQHSQNILGTPTCYIFPCPMDYPMASAPFLSLASYDGTREPGLVLLSPGGKVRFWDSIGLGLTGGEHAYTSSLGLEDEEIVTCFVRAGVCTCFQTFVLVRFAQRRAHLNSLLFSLRRRVRGVYFFYG